MVTKNYNNIWYATNLKTKLNILIPREIRCCYFIAFENFYHDFHLLVGSSVSVLTGYPWREGLLVYGRWCPLANTGSTAYGLEPGPESVFVLCVCVFFFNIRHRDNNRHRINCSEGQHLSHVQHQYFFLNIFFFCARCIRKNQSGLKVVRTHLFAHWLCFWIGFCGRNDLTDFYDFWYT